jgi:hypothetical protein
LAGFGSDITLAEARVVSTGGSIASAKLGPPWGVDVIADALIVPQRCNFSELLLV